MSKIEELLKENERIWFYIDNDKAGTHFMQEVEKMGGKFLDGSAVNKHSCGKIMAFGRDKKVAYVTLMVWCMSFLQEQKEIGKILKIDYDKFEKGEKDFVIKSCNFKRIN